MVLTKGNELQPITNAAAIHQFHRESCENFAVFEHFLQPLNRALWPRESEGLSPY